MNLVSVRNAVDLHIHSYPCLFPRIADDREIVRAAAEAGMAAVVLKCHHEPTVSRAYLLGAESPQIKVFGGIVLNSYVGGINPAAVEAALRLGGKEVWMPTIDSAYHAAVHGSTGVYDVQAGGRVTTKEGISVLRDGKLTAETQEVLELVAEHGAILGTAHLSPQEIKTLVSGARERGVKKVLITHPYFRVPNLDLSFLEEMVSLGAKAEFGYCTVSPMWGYATIEKVKSSIETLGAENCVIMSDAGQRHNPMPHESLRVFAQCLYEKGLSEAAIEQLMITNPKQLLGIE